MEKQEKEKQAVYYTDGIDEFIALRGFEEAVRIVAKTLAITSEQARERVTHAQRQRKNEI
ncbi:hypothetical protein [Paenibacillus sp. HB172176]|uniref:hypothetical protein n=1 Tax=Paenibacillus sp. HB172176 TaxID=2493690 RepID=UPI00143B124E|nr:hypothetical protein [Paenibacillus sp. HB172176]